MSDVAERVKKIVVEHLGVDADKVVDNANFIDDLGANSLDTVELVMAFEEEFGVEIVDEIRIVDDLVGVNAEVLDDNLLYSLRHVAHFAFSFMRPGANAGL